MTFASDALVVFGITGDLAYKQIFPALQAMIKRGHLNVPIVGVAKEVKRTPRAVSKLSSAWIKPIIPC